MCDSVCKMTNCFGFFHSSKVNWICGDLSQILLGWPIVWSSVPATQWPMNKCLVQNPSKYLSISYSIIKIFDLKYSAETDFHQQNFPNSLDMSNVSGPANKLFFILLFLSSICSINPVDANIITKCARKYTRQSQQRRWKLVRCQKDWSIFAKWKWKWNL